MAMRLQHRGLVDRLILPTRKPQRPSRVRRAVSVPSQQEPQHSCYSSEPFSCFSKPWPCSSASPLTLRLGVAISRYLQLQTSATSASSAVLDRLPSDGLVCERLRVRGRVLSSVLTGCRQLNCRVQIRQFRGRVLEFAKLFLIQGHFVDGRQWRVRAGRLRAAPAAAAAMAEVEQDREEDCEAGDAPSDPAGDCACVAAVGGCRGGRRRRSGGGRGRRSCRGRVCGWSCDGWLCNLATSQYGWLFEGTGICGLLVEGTYRTEPQAPGH